MKTRTQFVLDGNDATLLQTLVQAENRMAGFRDEAVAARVALGMEPMKGWHAVVTEQRFHWDDWYACVGYTDALLRAAESRLTDPEYPATARGAVEQQMTALRQAVFAFEHSLYQAEVRP